MTLEERFGSVGPDQSTLGLFSQVDFTRTRVDS